MKGYDRLWMRLLAAVAALALGVGMAACGSDDGDGGGPKGGDGDAAADVSGAAGDGDGEPGSDEAQIKAVYEDFVEAMYAGDGKAACNMLTTEARKGFGKAQGTTCEQRVRVESSSLSKFRPFINNLQVKGSRAVARAGAKNTLKYPVPFTKENGEWRISGGY